VPGLVEKVFLTDRSRSSWVKGAAVLPFECRGDADDLPKLPGYTTKDFDNFKAECRSDSDDEERRLAYVAMTRARHRLWLSSYLWSPTRKDACEPSRFLADVVELGARFVDVAEWCDPPEPEAVNPLLAVGIADVPWPDPPDPDEVARRRRGAAMVDAARTSRDESAHAASGDASVASLGPSTVEAPAGLSDGDQAMSQVWQRDADLLLDEIRRRRVRTIDVAVPSRLTTSQIVALARNPDAFATALARPMPSAPVAQARRGSRFHQWVERLYGASPLLEADDLPGAGDEDLTDDELAALQERFLADGWGERLPVAVEAPFEMVIGGRLIRGRIDAVYGDDAGTLLESYDVIDYKTGAVPTGAEFEAASLQLSVYRLAWADLAGVDPAVVQAGFLYVRTGEVKRPDRLLDRDELADLLTS
jgi:DNA helicase-2/ATP-dependent DNA helicase PcrA